MLGTRFLELAHKARRTAAAGTSEAINGDATFLGQITRALVVLDIASSATDAGDVLDVYVDVSLDDRVTWLNAIHFTQQAGNGSAAKQYALLALDTGAATVVTVTADAASGVVRPTLLGPQIRARWTITDGSADGDQAHTFRVFAFVW